MTFTEWLAAQPEMTMGEQDAASKAWQAAQASYSNYDDVYAFHEKMGMAPGTRPIRLPRAIFQNRIDFIHEELTETVEAYNDTDYEGVVDGLIDLVYVVLGTAVMMGLPWQQLWKEVHSANMRKKPGVSKRNMPFDAIKPEGWRPPDLFSILERYGYGREQR